MLRDMLEDWEGRLVLGIIVICVVLIPVGIYAAIVSERNWQAYASEHCQVVGKMSGSVSSGMGTTFTNGKVGAGPVTVYTPGKTGYACDDGMTYWR
jgi:hypothetical protein